MNTYMMNDIHGLRDHYDAMLEALALRNEDTPSVLGDVTDRGRDGITILLDIMNRNNVYMLLRNHEYMMRQHCEAIYHVITDIQKA